GGGGRQSVLVREQQRHHGEGGRDQELAEELVAGAQPGAVLLGDLEVVVAEPDHAEADGEGGQQQHGDAGRGRLHQVGEEGGSQDGQDDLVPAHRRRAALGGVGGGPVVADELPVAAAFEDLDEQRRAEDRQHEGDRPGDDDRDHCSAPVVGASSAGSPRCATRGPAISRSPASREDFSSTASPGRTVRCSTASASSTVPRCADSPPKLPSRLAPWWMGAAPSPTTYSWPMFRRTARRPISSWRRTVSSPSSSISPSTA